MSAASGTRCKRVQEIQGISLGVPKIGIELRSSLLTTTDSEQEEKILLEARKVVLQYKASLITAKEEI